MAIGTFDAIELPNGVVIHVEGGELVIDSGACSAVRVLVQDQTRALFHVTDSQIDGGTTLLVKAGHQARVDGGERVEIHADAVVRTDAGGAGDTLTPTHHHYFHQWYGSGHPPQPPEHPDSGGPAWWEGQFDLEAYYAEYYERFPEYLEDGE